MSIVYIKIRAKGKTRPFDATGLNLKINDTVVIEAKHGLTFGIVSCNICNNEEKWKNKKLKKVLRTANPQDVKKIEKSKEIEVDALQYCLGKINEKNLEMKLIEVESTLNCKKLVFYFIAENRVDFREIVKDIASNFKAKIEMRQIGSRDQARIVSGFGHCGCEFCCNTIIENFQPVTIKMVKSQGLSPNPSKTSGACGRLMCCLAFEYEGKPCAGDKNHAHACHSNDDQLEDDDLKDMAVEVYSEGVETEDEGTENTENEPVKDHIEVKEGPRPARPPSRNRYERPSRPARQSLSPPPRPENPERPSRPDRPARFERKPYDKKTPFQRPRPDRPDTKQETTPGLNPETKTELRPAELKPGETRTDRRPQHNRHRRPDQGGRYPERPKTNTPGEPQKPRSFENKTNPNPNTETENKRREYPRFNRRNKPPQTQDK